LISTLSVDYERLVVENLPLVDEIVRFIARRYRLSADQADELAAAARLKLVENEYGVLKQFEARSSLRTYLRTVIQRHFLDGRTAAWGKWRPSAIARRLGSEAVELDRLVTRDGMSFDEAAAVLLNRPGWETRREQLRAVMDQLPRRCVRRLQSDEGLAETAANGDSEDDWIREIDGSTSAARIDEALEAALQQLGEQDRLLLRMRFADGVRVTRMGRLLDIPQRQLYGRMESILRTLRRELEKRGVHRSHVDNIVGHSVAQLLPQIDPDGRGTPTGRPSVL
jgi:RNA polymerase sigma factor (sigma-70 family)